MRLFPFSGLKLLSTAILLILAQEGCTSRSSEKSPIQGKSPDRDCLFDVSKVSGMDHAGLTEDMKRILARNGFVAFGHSGGDISAFYDTSSPLPKFITVDLGVEVFLASLEIRFSEIETAQADRLKKFHALLWEELASRRGGIPGRSARAFERVMALVGVGRSLLDPGWTLPNSCPDLETVKRETGLAVQGEGRSPSTLFRRDLDWSRFKPLGPYSSTEELRQYYRLSRWWGGAGLQADDPEERLCAGILAWLVGSRSELGNILEGLGQTYDRFFGPPDDVSIFHLMPRIEALRPRGIELPRDFGTEVFDAWLTEAFSRAPEPALEKEGDRVMLPGQRPRALRLLPPRVTPETKIFANLLHPAVPGRWLPRGLDALAALGDPRARDLAVSMEEKPESGKRLDEAFRRMAQAREPKADDQSFQSVLWKLCLSLAQVPADPRIPKFMKTEAYHDRGLSRGLATWVGAREIYSPRVLEVYERKGISKHVPPLIEPNPEAWGCLIDLYRAAGLDPQLAERWRLLAERELRGEELTESDEYVGDQKLLDYLQNRLANLDQVRWRLPRIDRRTCVSFAQTTDSMGRVPETARWGGKASRGIYVIAETGGILRLYQGGILDYLEFDRPAGTMLTREDFRKLMDSKETIPPPAWTASYRGQ